MVLKTPQKKQFEYNITQEVLQHIVLILIYY
jgi:hypothetical protein